MFKRFSSFMLIATFLFLLSGCASFYCSRYPNNNYSPTNAEAIPIYNNFPPTPYEVIGEVGSDGAPASSWSGIGKKMREYAAQIGGDAIVIQNQKTPYVGTYNTPTTVDTTSTAYGSAQTSVQGSAHSSGNYIYGQAHGQTYGQAYGQSHTTIQPGNSIPMYGKSVRAVVIKFKSSEVISSSEQIVQDDKYGNISNKYFVYTNHNANLSKRGRVDLSKVFSSYQKTIKYDKMLLDKEKSKQFIPEELRKEQEEKMKEILRDIEKTMVEFGDKNRYRAIYNDRMPNCHEEDVSDKIIILLNS